MTLLIGADPEVFIRSGNVFVPSAHYIKGTKQVPYREDGWEGAVQVDGLAAEFNIDPTPDEDVFVKRIDDMMTVLNKSASALKAEVVAVPTAQFGRDRLDQWPREWTELGCNPDWNAWEEGFNPVPDAEMPFRTGSGHVHIGFTENADAADPAHLAKCFSIARQCDYYLGIYSLTWDGDGTRRQLYGRAGAFRPKSYGLEYRVMSNAWLKSPELMRWVFRAVKKCVEEHEAGNIATDTFGALARDIINENQVDWFDRYGDLVGLPIPTVVE
jgi:hypothetical protein